MKRTAAFTALTLAAALTLSACTTGTDDAEETATATETTTTATTEATTETITETTGAEETGAAVSPRHNQHDTRFAQGMIPHHSQAVDMSEILLAKDGVPGDVVELAEEIIEAQGPEIDRMNHMLGAWGQERVAGDWRHGMGHGHMAGMMTEADLAELEAANGPAAARLYLEQMIAHHEGAVEMAREHIADGMNPQAVELSEQIIADQEAEIAEMERMLADL